MATNRAKADKAKLEVHEHSFIRGPRSRWAAPHPSRTLVHSHPGGDVSHRHAETGPACYTIDKDDWLRTTGLRGGGRKKFTAKPSGEQLPTIPLTEDENSFEIIVGPPPPDHRGTGPGMALPARMILGFGMRVAAVRSFDDWRKARSGEDR